MLTRFLRCRQFDAREPDLLTLRELLAPGKRDPVIDRRYLRAAAAEAIRPVEQGRARGKVVITV